MKDLEKIKEWTREKALRWYGERIKDDSQVFVQQHAVLMAYEGGLIDGALSEICKGCNYSLTKRHDLFCPFRQTGPKPE